MSYADRHHTVYRLFGADGVLLYVGRTGDFQTRLRQHRKPWTPGGSAWSYNFHDLITTWTLESGFSEAQATARERDVIRAESPLYNRWRPRPVPCGPLVSRWPNWLHTPRFDLDTEAVA